MLVKSIGQHKWHSGYQKMKKDNDDFCHIQVNWSWNPQKNWADTELQGAWVFSLLTIDIGSPVIHQVTAYLSADESEQFYSNELIDGLTLKEYLLTNRQIWKLSTPYVVYTDAEV